MTPEAEIAIAVISVISAIITVWKGVRWIWPKKKKPSPEERIKQDRAEQQASIEKIVADREKDKPFEMMKPELDDKSFIDNMVKQSSGIANTFTPLDIDWSKHTWIHDISKDANIWFCSNCGHVTHTYSHWDCPKCYRKQENIRHYVRRRLEGVDKPTGTIVSGAMPSSWV